MTPLLRHNGRAALPLVAAIGFYDGVHLGHRHLLGQVMAEARRRGMGALAVTFANHPRTVVPGGQAPRLLTTADEKAALLRAAGLDAVAMLRFTPGSPPSRRVSSWSRCCGATTACACSS